MMRIIFYILITVFTFARAYNERNIVCYFSSWAIHRQGNGKMDIDQIDPHLCTHLIYTFIGLENNGSIKVFNPQRDLSASEAGGSLDGFGKFNRLRGVNPKVKTLISIGGWSQDSEVFSEVVANAVTRVVLVENIIKFTRKYGFDGFDIYWQYPNRRGGVEADKQNFVHLLKILKKRFDEERLILSAAAIAVENLAKQSYNIPELAKYVHYVNLIAWDMHGFWSTRTGHTAPLYAGSWQSNEEKFRNVNASVHYWLFQGAPAEKLILGIPLYGRSFTLDNSTNNCIGASAQNKGIAGPYTKKNGTLGYNEICEAQLAGGWEVKFQEEKRVSYAVKGDQWVGYDDPKSVQEKAEYINALGLGGAMVWGIEVDDFRGVCGEKFPIIKTLNRVLRNSLPSTASITIK